MKIRRPCSHIGCKELTTYRYCDKHAAQHLAVQQQQTRQSNRAYNKHRPEWHSLYSTSQWSRLRLTQLSQHPWCAECLRYGVRKIAEQVDHIIPHAGDMSLFFDPDNLQSICTKCHSVKTVKENGGFGNRRKQ